jgi:hypothetical protein
MIVRLYPSKDTWITDYRSLGVPKTGSNFGASEILWVFKQLETSVSSTLGRILSLFDISSIPSLSASNASYRLVMHDARHCGTLPSSFDIQVHPVSGSWDEGRGLDEEGFYDLGYANWDKAKSDVFWNSPGSDFYTESFSTVHFDQGNEDMSADVTQIVTAWLTDSIPNNGFLVRISSSQETNNVDYFVKKFHSRNTNFLDRRPYLQIQWDDSIQTGSISLASGSEQFFVSIPYLKNQYEAEEVVRLRLFVRDNAYNPAVVLTASSDSNGLAVARGYYRITNDRTDEAVVPFGTASYQGGVDNTRLSYDSSGNYFDFRMDSLAPGNVYRIVFLFDVGGQKQLVDGNFKFKVV